MTTELISTFYHIRTVGSEGEREIRIILENWNISVVLGVVGFFD